MDITDDQGSGALFDRPLGRSKTDTGTGGSGNQYRLPGE